jgi:hypothetical protein
VPAAAAGLIAAGGCATGGDLPPDRAAAGPCAAAPGGTWTEGAAGVALAFSRPDGPRDLDQLAALVAEPDGREPRWATGGARELADPVGVAAQALGVPACRQPAAGLVRIDQSEADGSPRARLVRPSTAGAEKLAAARRHLEAGEDPEARTALQAAAAHEAALPVTLLAVGDSYARAGRWAEAQAVFARASREFPWAAEAWAGLARAQRAGDRRLLSLATSARALALFPADADSRAPLLTDPFVILLAPVPPPAVPAGAGGGWQFVAGPGRKSGDPFARAEAGAYAGCRERFRRSAELRARLATRDIPEGRWSPAEESACTAVWLRMYLRNRGQGRAADPGLDDLVEVAREGLLDERALHDLAGLADPRLLWLLDEPRRQRLFTFVERHRVVARQDAGFLPFL